MSDACESALLRGASLGAPKPGRKVTNMRPVWLLSVIITTLLPACAREVVKEPKDLVLDFGRGDSVRLVGQADNFKCDDPAYARVEKVRTFTLVFADGTTQELCKPKSPLRANDVEVRD